MLWAPLHWPSSGRFYRRFYRRFSRPIIVSMATTHLKQRSIKCDYPYSTPKRRQNSGKCKFYFLFLLGFDKFSPNLSLNDFRYLRLSDGAFGDLWDYLGTIESRFHESTAYFVSSKVIGCRYIGDTPGSP